MDNLVLRRMRDTKGSRKKIIFLNGSAIKRGRERGEGKEEENFLGIFLIIC